MTGWPLLVLLYVVRQKNRSSITPWYKSLIHNITVKHPAIHEVFSTGGPDGMRHSETQPREKIEYGSRNRRRRRRSDANDLELCRRNLTPRVAVGTRNTQ